MNQELHKNKDENARPLDTPKRMIERREREGEREKERQKDRYREGGRDKREREKERERCKRYRERESKGVAKSTPVQGVRSRRKPSGNLPSGSIKHKERLITKIMTQ